MPPHPLSLVVLTCGSLGLEVAARLHPIPGVRSVVVIRTPYRQRRRTTIGKVRHLYRTEGLPGFLGLVRRRLRGAVTRPLRPGPAPPTLVGGAVAVLDFPDFHAPNCVAALRDLTPDLGVIAGTYILRESVFTIPRMGCINLHCGKVPEYRGAAPAFWELFNGESSVGVTIHRVSARVDEGAVLLQELFPLDPAPTGDPMDYLRWYREAVLRPHGVRLLAEAVARIAQGTVDEQAQDPSTARTYRSPNYEDVRELRSRVKRRQACAVT